MATVFESPHITSRIRQIEEQYDENGTFGKCDCTSYSYLLLSILLCVVGSAITILALGNNGREYKFYFGQMWLVGPFFIVSGLTVAAKCMVYLRRKSVIQMIIHQRQLFRLVREEMAGNAPGMSASGSGTPVAGPPPYEVIVQSQGSSELPPPTYAEAVALLQQCGYQDAKPCCAVDAGETSAPIKP